MKPPIIFVPGLFGSILQDEYEIPPEEVWRGKQGTLKQYTRIRLHPVNARYEHQEPARVMAAHILDRANFAGFKVIDVYTEIINHLRDALGIPVYPFFYDWRQHLDLLRDELAQFVEEVVARTALMPEYKGNYTEENGKVNLVGHSMGGLLIAGYMTKKNSMTRVNKIVTIGTPFRGSPRVLEELCTEIKPVYEANRSAPAAYYFIPRYKNAVCDEDGNYVDLFEIDNWQKSIVKTFMSDGDFESAKDNFRKILAKALEYRDAIKNLNKHLKEGGWPLKENWLCIIGDDEGTTLGRVKIEKGKDGGNIFNFFKRPKEEDKKARKELMGDGDGTVPKKSAIPEFFDSEDKSEDEVADYKYVVGYKYEDFEWFDDWPKAVGAGLHAMLPSMNVLIRVVTAYLGDGWKIDDHLSEIEEHGKYGELWTRKI